MYNDDIFTLIMSAEESMLKAELGIEDSYEAYVMEEAVEEAIAMEASYVDSYGWDLAMEDATAAIEDKSTQQLAIGEHKATFGDKIRAAGEWIWKALQTLWEKAKQAWAWIREKFHNLINAIFKKQKEVEKEESGAGTDSDSSSGSDEGPAGDIKGRSRFDDIRYEPRGSSNEIVPSTRGEVAPRSTQSRTEEDNGDSTAQARLTGSTAKAQGRLGASKTAPGLPDHKEFNKALPTRYQRAQIIEANRKKGITETQVNKVKSTADSYVKSLFSYIQKSLDVANTASQLMDQLRTLKFNTLNKDNKAKDFEDKFEKLDNSIAEIDDFSSKTSSAKADFEDATGEVPNWNVYIDAKTIHGYTGMVNNIYAATKRHEAFCDAFIKFVDKHKNESGASFKNPQDLRVDGKTVSGGVVIDSTPTNLIYRGSKLYLKASTSTNKVVSEYRSAISKIIATN